MKKFLIKKSNILIVVSLLVVVLVCGGILAYMTSSDTSDNSFKIGGCNVDVVEEFTPPKKLEPGISFTKNVRVENKGPSECFVRIKAAFTDSDMGKYCDVDWNTTDYVYNDEDGYYYYKEKLEVGDFTSSLFTTVTLSDTMSASEIKDFDILIYAEAYQAEGFNDYEEAWEHYQRNKPTEADVPK